MSYKLDIFLRGEQYVRAKENFGLCGIEIHILIIFFVCIDDAVKSDNVATTPSKPLF